MSAIVGGVFIVTMCIGLWDLSYAGYQWAKGKVKS